VRKEDEMIKENGGDTRGLMNWQPPPPLVVEEPKLEELFGALVCDSWLEEEYASMSSFKSPTFAARAVGTVARLGRVGAKFRSLFPEWVEGLSKEALDEIEVQAQIDAGNMAESLEFCKGKRVGQDEETDQDLGVTLAAAALDRDDVESMIWVLRQAGRIDKYSYPEYLSAVDKEAEELLKEIGFFSARWDFEFESQRLLVAAGLYVEAWWPMVVLAKEVESESAD